MKIGTYYYPEQWPRQQWERDFDNIAAMGLQIVHMAEFAWFSLEPSPGNFQFDWLAQCVEMARKRKLDVILCTPTAAPPIWLSRQHPETLPQNPDGTRSRFGSRRHYSPTSPAMIEATKRIVTALADRFGNDPSVIGWQIDNEYCGWFDQSPHTHEAFRAWLRNKYGLLDALNKAWGCQFWNTYYTDFDQVMFPTSRDPGYGNPHHCLDASRFWSWAYANFNKVQADILRPRVGNRFITTNFMPLHPDCNPGDMANELDLFSWDSYPVTGWGRDHKDETFRLGNPSAIGFMHDQMRSYRDRWALMELQPGQINWSGYPVLTYPGAVRLWIWTAFAHGAEFVTTYRYRQPRFGTELFHHGLIGPDGVTPSPGGRQFVQVIDEMKRLKRGGGAGETSASMGAKPPSSKRRSAVAAPGALAGAGGAGATVGIVFDFDQLWYFQTLPQAKRWDYGRLLQTWYAALMRLGLDVRVLHPDRPWPSDLRLMVAPGVQMVDDTLVSRWRDFANTGGHLVLTCRSALMDRNGQLFEGHTAQPILDLIGATVEAYDALPEGQFGQVEMDGAKYDWGVWGDLLYANPDTRAVAKYADQFYAGAVAVTQNRVGQGGVTYCGLFGEQAFTDALVERIAGQLKLPAAVLPPRVQVLKRGPYRVLLNYQDAPVEAPAAKGATFIVGARRVEPAGVAVWEE